MDHQDWTVVTIKRTPKKEISHPFPNYLFPSHSFHSHPFLNHSFVHSTADGLHPTYPPTTCIAAESLQALIRKRLEMKLTQEKVDHLCQFPVHTCKNLEARRLTPTEKHQLAIQEHLGIQLKIELR